MLADLFGGQIGSTGRPDEIFISRMSADDFCVGRQKIAA